MAPETSRIAHWLAEKWKIFETNQSAYRVNNRRLRRDRFQPAIPTKRLMPLRDWLSLTLMRIDHL
jgi:hypothetical protein